MQENIFKCATRQRTALTKAAAGETVDAPTNTLAAKWRKLHAMHRRQLLHVKNIDEEKNCLGFVCKCADLYMCVCVLH